MDASLVNSAHYFYLIFLFKWSSVLSNKCCIFYSNLQLHLFQWTTETKLGLCFLSLVWEIVFLKQMRQYSPEEHCPNPGCPLKQFILSTGLSFRRQNSVSSWLIWTLLVQNPLRGFQPYSITQRRPAPPSNIKQTMSLLTGTGFQWAPHLVRATLLPGTFRVVFMVTAFLSQASKCGRHGFPFTILRFRISPNQIKSALPSHPRKPVASSSGYWEFLPTPKESDSKRGLFLVLSPSGSRLAPGNTEMPSQRSWSSESLMLSRPESTPSTRYTRPVPTGAPAPHRDSLLPTPVLPHLRESDLHRVCLR